MDCAHDKPNKDTAMKTRHILAAAVLVFQNAVTVQAEEKIRHMSEISDLKAIHAWAPATDADTAFVYFELENEGEGPVSVTGTDSPIAEAVEIVGFWLRQGEETYERIAAVPLSPGSVIHFEPGGLAVRLSRLTRPLIQGEHFTLDLQTDLGTLELDVAIEASSATAHSHAGHSH